MFTVDCPRHGREVLIWPSNLDGVSNTPHGILVHYHCTCGHRGAILTGRNAPGGRTVVLPEEPIETGARRSA